MIIQLDQIKDQGLDLEWQRDAAEFPELLSLADAGECRFKGPVAISLRLQRLGGMIEVQGQIGAEIELGCSRCLEEFVLPLRSEFELTFSPGMTVNDELSGEELELSPEELGLIPFSGEEIDLAETLQEQLVMALPLRPLCADDCRGLCPHCGVNLNQERCDCPQQGPSLKFAALKDFKVNPDK